MSQIVLMIILLANQGYWYGGDTQTFALAPNLTEWPAGSVAHWALCAGEIELSKGDQRLQGAQSHEIKLRVPDVRATTLMTLRIRVVDVEGNPIDQADRVVHVFPDDLRPSVAPRFWKARQILLVGATGLEEHLKSVKPAPQALSDVQRLQTHVGDLVIVGPEVLNERDGHEATIMAVAERGATVLVLRQKAETVVGLAVAARSGEERPRIDLRHPVFAGIDRDMVQSMLASDALAAVTLPVDADVMEVMWYESQNGSEAAPLDALIAVRGVGDGRVIWCQLPLGDVERDPRSKMLLDNLIAYASTRPEPTPRRSERGKTLILIPAEEREIAVPGGVGK